MSKTEAKKIARQYANKLKKNHMSVSSMYLFGSQAEDKTHQDSDIDVAVISPIFKNNFSKNSLKFWQMRREIDSRIEPHGFTQEDFNNLADPLVYEIKKNGIRII